MLIRISKYFGPGAGGSQFKATLGKYFMRLYLEKPITKTGLVE
jgi:hypothetical protein